MIERENELLAEHTTIRIGGRAEKFYIPENESELRQILIKHQNAGIISGGSNLLINDRKVFPAVVSMEKCCVELIWNADGSVYAGSSVRAQQLIRTLNQWGLGGIEYLYSLPAMVGGMVFMNAGRGGDKKSIADHIISVRYMTRDGDIAELPAEDCHFEYRKSLFQDKDWVILGALFRFEPIDTIASEQRIAEQMERCRLNQDRRFPNFGSLFGRSNQKIMVYLQKHAKSENGRKSACLSSKSSNWVINRGEGTFSEVKRIIKKVRLLHKIAGQQCEIEVRIWE